MYFKRVCSHRMQDSLNLSVFQISCLCFAVCSFSCLPAYKPSFFSLIQFSGLLSFRLSFFLSFCLPLFQSAFFSLFLSLCCPVFLSIYLPIFLSSYFLIFPDVMSINKSFSFLSFFSPFGCLSVFYHSVFRYSFLHIILPSFFSCLYLSCL